MPYTATDTRLGVEPKTDHEIRISLTDRYSGIYVLGTQGMGKSGLLQTIIADDVAKGMAVVVIDPHGATRSGADHPVLHRTQCGCELRRRGDATSRAVCEHITVHAARVVYQSGAH